MNALRPVPLAEHGTIIRDEVQVCLELKMGKQCHAIFREEKMAGQAGDRRRGHGKREQACF